MTGPRAVVGHAGTFTKEVRMSRWRTPVVMMLMAPVVVATAASCTSDTDPAAQPSSSVSACDDEQITAAIGASYATTAASEGTGLQLQSASGIECAGSWAVAQVRIGDGLAHDFGDREVLQRIGDAWQVADRMLVCGSIDPRHPRVVPSDAQVPERLYAIACKAQ